MKKNENRETAPGAPIAWESPSLPEEVQPGYGYVADNNESEETYYYHSDHLGSTSYITDDSARITQYTAYLPYGELLVDEHSSSEDMPYKFNGKELDEETGLYYYGARYMQPITSVWYGIDPLTEKYPDVSAYAYCMGNPVKLVDSDGCKPSEEEAARMADHVYGKLGDDVLTGGWKVSKKKFNGVTLKKENIGFKSNIYERTINSETEYAYVLAGTDFDSWKDWKNNLQQVAGKSPQYALAMDNADNIARALGVEDNTGNKLTFVGHSLGGGMAAACAYKTKGYAMTFNAAGVSFLTVWKNFSARIHAYRNTSDELNNAMFRMCPGLQADGIPHLRINRANKLGHSIENFYKPGFFESIYNKTGEYFRKMNSNLENLRLLIY